MYYIRPPMRCTAYLTEMTLATPLPRVTIMWMAGTTLIAALYVLRAVSMEIPPQDHVAISLVLCFLLTQIAMSMEQTILRISLPDNRCWLFHHRHGKRRARSLPVSQIHSAHVEFEQDGDNSSTRQARLILTTSLGMIPISERYQDKASELSKASRQINEFLGSQNLYLRA